MKTNSKQVKSLTEDELEFIRKHFPPGGKGLLAALDCALSRIKESSTDSDVPVAPEKLG